MSKSWSRINGQDEKTVKVLTKDEELLYAVLRGDIEAIKDLIKQGVDLDSCNDEGATPLHRAMDYVSADVIKFLLENGANVNCKDNDDNTPLLFAVANGREDIVKLLLEHGAYADGKDVEGSTSLHFAALNGHTDIARLLLEHGAGLNYQDIDGNTPLHNAVANGHIDLVNLFLEYDANVDLKAAGLRPIDMALYKLREKESDGDKKNFQDIAKALQQTDEKSLSQQREQLRHDCLNLSSREICERLISDQQFAKLQKAFDGNFAPLVEKMEYNDAMRVYVHIYKKLTAEQRNAYTKSTLALQRKNNNNMTVSKKSNENSR